MKSKKLYLLLALVLVLSMLVVSCSKKTTPPEAPATEAPAAADTVAPTEAKAADTVAPTEATVADTVAPTEVTVADTAAPTEAAAAEEPTATEATLVKHPVAEHVAVDHPAEPVENVSETADNPTTFRWAIGASDVPTVDPSLTTDTTSNQATRMLFGGLVSENEVTGLFENAIATDVKISDDNLTYTYTIRTDIPWVKYNAETGKVEVVKDCKGNTRWLTAYDFEYGIKRTVDPATASDYAYVPTAFYKGAQEYYEGKGTWDDVGVKALDEKTLAITFVRDVVPNSMIPGLWVSYAEPQWLIEGDECTEAAADRWGEPENIQTYGPYAMKDWVHDDQMNLVRNPYWVTDMASVPAGKFDNLDFVVLSESAAQAAYESDEIQGQETVSLADVDRIQADPQMSKELSIGENYCTYFYGFNTNAQYVDDVRVRKALSESIDRQSLIDNVTKGHQAPAQWFARPGLVGAPKMSDHPDLGIKYNPEDAKALINDYCTEKGIKPEDITVNLTINDSEAHVKIAQAVQAMWKDTLGINATVSQQEWAVYLKTIRSAETPQVWRLGWCMDYPDASNFEDDAKSGGSANPVGDDGKPSGGLMWKNDEFESLLETALSEKDSAKRIDEYAQAEDILVNKDAVMAPLYWYTSMQLVKSNVDRTYSVLGGVEALNKWSYLPEGQERAPQQALEQSGSANIPAADVTTEAPATDMATEAPATDMATEAPATDMATEAPAADAATEAPAADMATEAPAADAATEAPAADMATEAPAADTATEAPAADMATEAPAADAATEAPAADMATEAPAADAATEAPAADMAAAAPATETKSFFYLNFKPEIADVYTEIAKEYEKQTGVKMEVQTAASGTYEQTLKTAMDSDDAPALFQINGPVGYNAWKDYTADLKDTELYKHLADKSLAVTSGDGVYGIPYVVEGYGIIYNNAIMDKYFAMDGAKAKSMDEITSFETLKAVVEDMQSKKSDLGIDGVFASTSLKSGEDWRWQTHLMNLPVYYEFKKENVDLSSDAVKTLKFEYADNFKNIFDLYINNSCTDAKQLGSKSVDDSMADFALGKAAMVQNGNWAWSQINGVKGNVVKSEDIKFMPIYIGVDGEADQGLCIGTENYFAVNSKADPEKQKLAEDFIYWLYSSKEGKDFVTNKLNFITPFDTFEDSELPTDPLAKEVVRWMNNGKTSVAWDFQVFPNQAFKDALGADLLGYAQGTVDWDTVVSDTVDSWASEYESAQ